MRIGRRAYLASVGTGLLAGLAGCSFGAQVAVQAEGLEAAGGGDWSRQVKLTATDESVAQFGSSVALAGDGRTALVAADHHEDADGLRSGPAYVLERTDQGWRSLAELVPDGAGSEGNFGGPGGSSALSADGSTALVGADKADVPNGSRAGRAYVFERGDGGWGRQFELLPAEIDTQDFFGSAVALSGDGRRAFVGAWNDENADGAEVGATYVFERGDDGWRRRARIAPDQASGAGRFGWSVALEDETALIGDPADDEPDGEAAGAAHVYERIGGDWRRQTRLAPAGADAGDFVGGSVALEGDTALVGAPEDDDPNGERAGSAYVFRRASDGWREEAKLVPDDGDPIDLFGVAVALSGDTALIGARVDEDPNGETAGSAYVFERADDDWRQVVKLAAADGESHDVFGRSVALEGETALIGSTRGGAYVFE